MNCSPPGSSVHGTLQARILQWVAIPFSRVSSHPGTEPGSPTLQADYLQSEPPGKYLKPIRVLQLLDPRELGFQGRDKDEKDSSLLTSSKSVSFFFINIFHKTSLVTKKLTGNHKIGASL